MTSPAALSPQELEKYTRERINRAIECYNAGDFLEVRKLCLEILHVNPQYAHAYYLMGNVVFSRGDYNNGIMLMQSAIKYNSLRGEYYCNLGGMYQDVGMQKEAEKCLLKAIKLTPNYGPIYRSLGYIYFGKKDKKKAINYLEIALKLDPEDAQSRHLLATISGETPEIAPAHYVKHLFDNYAHRFDQHLQQVLQYNTPHAIAEKLEPALTARSNARLLDLGCGTGLMGEALAARQLKPRITGVDLSSKMITIAEQKNVTLNLYESLHVEEISSFLQKSPDASYEAIVAADVFVYIGKLDGIFAEAQRVLAVGGIFAFSVENGDDAPPYVLRGSARYAHALSYLQELACQHHFTISTQDAVALRQDGKETIQGYVVVMLRS